MNSLKSIRYEYFEQLTANKLNKNSTRRYMFTVRYAVQWASFINLNLYVINVACVVFTMPFRFYFSVLYHKLPACITIDDFIACHPAIFFYSIKNTQWISQNLACAKARAYIEYSGTAKSMNGPVHCRILASIFYSFNVIEKTSVCGNRVARVAHMRIMVELLTINDPFYSKSIGVREVNFWCVCATATPTSFFWCET